MAVIGSGWTGILEGTDTGLEVENKLTASFAAVDGDVSSIDVRLAAVENSHELLLNATSLADTQTPIGTDTALKIEFGAAQVTTNIDISATGDITFKVPGKYIIAPFFQYGRVGSAGTSIMFNRLLVNGAQYGASLSAKIDSANTLVPWSSSIQLTVAVNDVLTIEMIRDSLGNDSGGLFASAPTAIGWAVAPCASIQIYKAI